MSAILDRTRTTLAAVGHESALANGIWRLLLGGSLAIAPLLGGIIVWEASKALDTLDKHTDALIKMEKSQAVVKNELVNQNQKVDKAIDETGAIETRTRTLEDHFSNISGKLDVLLTAVKPNALP